MVVLVLNISMLLLKFLVGVMSGFLVVIVDGMYSVIDVLFSFMGLVINKLFDLCFDRDYFYGYCKYEVVGVLGIVGFILFIVFEILLCLGERFFEGFLFIWVIS